jgi:hypothetical protein
MKSTDKKYRKAFIPLPLYIFVRGCPTIPNRKKKKSKKKQNSFLGSKAITRRSL